MANKITHNSAIVAKAAKLAAYLHTHNKNLTKVQYQMVEDLYTVITDWNYVKNHFAEFNLNGVRQKED